jgi:virginiamycin B lyase
MKKYKLCAVFFVLLGFFVLGGEPAPLQAQSSEYLYWSYYANNSIGRVRLDGTEFNPVFISGLNGPLGIAVNEKYIYWAQLGHLENSIGTSIGRANLDGSDVNPNFITGCHRPWGLAIDENFVYWGSEPLDWTKIGRAKLDGTEINHSFIELTSSPRGITVSQDHIYWGCLGADSSTGSVGRAKVDGTEVEGNWITDLTYHPHGVAVTQDHIYWSNVNLMQINSWIARAKLDGTGAEIVFPGPFGLPSGIVIKENIIYWSTWNGWISWAKLDGSEYHPNWLFVDQCGQIAVTPLRVEYTFEGFFTPIENSPVVNQAKAGQAIPVKWRITDKNGLPISNPGSFINITSYGVNCATLAGDPTSIVVEELSAGSSGLQYQGDGWWQFNWKTSKFYKGQCRVMKLTLDDKSEHTASFSFK